MYDFTTLTMHLTLISLKSICGFLVSDLQIDILGKLISRMWSTGIFLWQFSCFLCMSPIIVILHHYIITHSRVQILCGLWNICFVPEKIVMRWALCVRDFWAWAWELVNYMSPIGWGRNAIDLLTTTPLKILCTILAWNLEIEAKILLLLLTYLLIYFPDVNVFL